MKWEDIISKKRKGTRWPKIIRKRLGKYAGSTVEYHYISQKKGRGKYGRYRRGKIDKDDIIYLWKEDAVKLGKR